MPDKMEKLEQFKEYIETAEKNLSFSNDNADEVALKYYKMALEINPTDTEVKQQYETLDKIVNHKNYKYSINEEQTIELMKIFVDCCNVKEFERLYKIISDEFVCISRYFGRTKKSFIDSVYFERKSMMGLHYGQRFFNTRITKGKFRVSNLTTLEFYFLTLKTTK